MSSRPDRREYEADVYYDVWMRGGDPDRIDWDRVDDARWGGAYSDDAGQSEYDYQMQAAARRRAQEREEEEYYEAMRAEEEEYYERFRSDEEWLEFQSLDSWDPEP